MHFLFPKRYFLKSFFRPKILKNDSSVRRCRKKTQIKLHKRFSPHSHCAFSLNLFHQQIVQIAILQLGDSENKKCSPWKVFGIGHPQNLRLLSRRGPRSRSPDARLSQHYIGPKMTFQHFSNFCRKKFPGLKKEISCTYWMSVEVLSHDFCKLQHPKLYRNVQELYCQARKHWVK